MKKNVYIFLKWILVVLAFSPVVLVTLFYIIFTASFGFKTSNDLFVTPLLLLLIFLHFALAFCITSDSIKNNLVGCLIIILFVAYLFYENSIKFPPIKTTPAFTLYFISILFMNRLITTKSNSNK